jgi:hypothetical protein
MDRFGQLVAEAGRDLYHQKAQCAGTVRFYGG